MSDSTEGIQIFLVRHGNTFEADERPVWVGRTTDMPLTTFGCSQAEAVGLELLKKGVEVKAIYHGSLKRQAQSAKIIANTMNATNVQRSENAALEELDYGDWEGLHTDEVKEKWPKVYSDWLEALKWPETVFHDNFHERLRLLATWLEHLRSVHQSGDYVIATSSNGILRLLNYFDRTRWQKITESREGASLKVRTGAYCEIRISEAGLRVCDWNRTPSGN